MTHSQQLAGEDFEGLPVARADEPGEFESVASRVLLLGLSASAEQFMSGLLAERLSGLAKADLNAVQPADLSPSRYDLIMLEDQGAESGHAESLWNWLAKQGLPFLILSEEPDARRAVRAQRAGACGYLSLPTRWEDVAAVLESLAIRERNIATHGAPKANDLAVWEDPSMEVLEGQARRVALTHSTVLLRGEKGVGKSCLARSIHTHSNRGSRPWIEVDADASSEEDLALALFGTPSSMVGFTERPVRGALEQAQGGTLYIREFACLPKALQVRLLRALERGEEYRLGDSTPTPFDIRILASSSDDLGEAVAEGRLREDLYYELSTVELRVPPLRERPQDIEVLAKHVLREQNERYGTRTRWSNEALEHLKGLPWDGNVRELRRFVQRCFVCSGGPSEFNLGMVEAESDRLKLSSIAPALPTVKNEDHVVVSVGESIAMAERKLIEATLKRFEGDKRLAAETLGISLKTLYTRLQRYRASAAG